MKKLAISVAIFIIIIAGCTIAYLLFTGPRMRAQINYRHFQAAMPVISPNTVPVKDIYEPLPTEQQAKKLTNPFAGTQENFAKGKIYYGYYCAFCHGDKGDGYGPVGYSYVPKPADLREAKIQKKSDGEILYAMLTGTGHSPMLQRIVPPQDRWYLVLYVRQFGQDFNTPP
jgi:hypothetical protein